LGGHGLCFCCLLKMMLKNAREKKCCVLSACMCISMQMFSEPLLS
jgi:hypothetical protein